MKIAVVGCWHQGVVGAACLADMGHGVVGYDADSARVAKLNAGESPLFEPGLNDLLRTNVQSGGLSFTNDPAAAVTGCELVMVMHDTPVDENDQSDLSGILADMKAIAKALAEKTVLYVTAQVPVGTCDRIAEVIRSANPDWKGGIAYSPENLRLGQAIERFKHPPLPVIGTDSPETYEALKGFLQEFAKDWKHVAIRTAEMSKHALNAFLATSITFANELGQLCDEIGADGHELATILRMEPRIGSKAMLLPGLGFSGGTLARDMQTLRGLGDTYGVDTKLLDGTWAANQAHNKVVVGALKKLLGGDLKGKQVTVLGLTYKPDTSTLRRSAALEVIADLNREQACVHAHDPKADREELKQYAGFEVFNDPYEAAAGSDALVLMTPWADYRDLDPARLKALLKGDVVFDSANLWPTDAWESAGLVHITIGRGRGAST